MLPALFLVAQAAAATSAPVTWHDIALGAPASSLRQRLGDPLRVLPFNDGKTRVARYWLPGANSTYVLVIEERGYIAGFDTFTDLAPTAVIESVAPDPLGVHLGDTLSSVKAGHPGFRSDVDESGSPFLIGRAGSTAGVAYSFEKDRVYRIHWATSVPGDEVALAPLASPSGDSALSAILDVQQNETDGVAWEYRYLTFHPCTETARWQVQNQALLHDGGRAYDRLHVICPTTKADRDFYFDITSYFGKL